MELSKKTTILFSPEQHERLSRLASSRGTSMGELVREACNVVYGEIDTQSRVSAVAALARLTLPVGPPVQMKRESQPDPDSLLP